MFFWELSAFSCIKKKHACSGPRLPSFCACTWINFPPTTCLQPERSHSSTFTVTCLRCFPRLFPYSYQPFYFHISTIMKIQKHFPLSIFMPLSFASSTAVGSSSILSGHLYPPAGCVYLCLRAQFLWVRSVIRHLLHCTIPYVSHVVQSQCEYISRLVCAVHFYEVRSGEIIVQEVWCLV